MSQKGSIKVVTYISQMTIPIENAKVFVYTERNNQRKLIGVRSTGKNGETTLIEIETPDKKESLTPLENGSENPFASVNIFIEAEGFRSVLVHDAQVFADNVTLQNVEMVPLGEPAIREQDKTIDVFVTPQSLNIQNGE